MIKNGVGPFLGVKKGENVFRSEDKEEDDCYNMCPIIYSTLLS